MADTDTAPQQYTPPAPSAPVQTDDPQLTSTIPLQGSDQTVDVNTPQPGEMPQAADTPQLTDTIPSETYPNNPDLSRDAHEAWWRRALDKAGSMLGGDTTVHITKGADGSVTMTHDPSTGGEKWGRIAAAALTGAASGFQNSQGPGGLGRAAAAGVQAGAQLPQQREQQAQQQVDFGNKQLLATANRIHLTQQAVLMGQQAKLNDIQIDQTTADTAAKELQLLSDSPNAQIIGTVDTGDPRGVMNAAKQNPKAMDAFLGKGNQALRMVPIGDHKLQMVLVDKTWEEQKNDVPRQAFYEDTDQNGKLVMKSKTLPPGANTNASINNNNTAAWNTHLAHLKTQGDADKAEADANKQPEAKTTLQMEQELNDPKTTPVRKAQLTATLAADTQREIRLREAGKNVTTIGTVAPGTTPADMIKPGGRFAPETVPGVNAEKLASGDLTLNDLPKRMAKGQATPQEMVAAAEQYSQNMYGLGYSPTMIDAEKRQFDNMKVQGVLDGIDKMAGVGGTPGYLDTVVNLANQAGVGANAPWNEISLAVKKKLGDQAAKNFNTALGEVQRSLPGLIGNPLLGGSDSDQKLRLAQDMFGKDVTAGNMLSTANTLKGMLAGSKDSLTRNNRFLQRRYGLKGPYAAQSSPTTGGGQPNNPQPTPTPAPQAGGLDQSNLPPMNKLPVGHDTTFANGQVWRNVNGQPQRIK